MILSLVLEIHIIVCGSIYSPLSSGEVWPRGELAVRVERQFGGSVKKVELSRRKGEEKWELGTIRSTYRADGCRL